MRSDPNEWLIIALVLVGLAGLGGLALWLRRIDQQARAEAHAAARLELPIHSAIRESLFILACCIPTPIWLIGFIVTDEAKAHAGLAVGGMIAMVVAGIGAGVLASRRFPGKGGVLLEDDRLVLDDPGDHAPPRPARAVSLELGEGFVLTEWQCIPMSGPALGGFAIRVGREQLTFQYPLQGDRVAPEAPVTAPVRPAILLRAPGAALHARLREHPRRVRG